MSIKLSKRLSKIVELCDPVDTIIDVGTDHGKVPITIANLGISKNVIAIDNKPGPLEFCKKNAELYLKNIDVNFKLLLSDGLEKVDKNIESGIIISGIGFDNMKEIIQDINEYNFKYMILSPHTKITELIKYLSTLDILVTEQENVFEDNKYYYIIKVVKGKNFEN